MMRRIAWIGCALMVAATPLAAQQPYPQTLYWDTGLIDVPVASVGPISGDMAISYSGKTFRRDPDATKLNWSGTMNSQLVLSMSYFGRLETGFAAYSSNPEFGFFGRALLIRESDLGESGLARWIVPSIAIGARNVGPYSHIDRFGIGYNLLPPDASQNSRHVPDSLHQNFNTANTIYGVATKSFSLRDIRPTWADANLSFSVGYGNGLFKDDGGLGSAYARHATGGLFYGGRLELTPTSRTTLALMAENNAWDYNIGAVLGYRGIQAGLYLTELGSGASGTSTNTAVYNYSKVAFTLGWQSNIFALLHGNFLQGKAAALERQREQLLAEITQRQQRVAQLELEINRYEAQNLLELEQRRAAAEVQLHEERAALQRLEERLRRVEQQLPPSSTPPQQP